MTNSCIKARQDLELDKWAQQAIADRLRGDNASFDPLCHHIMEKFVKPLCWKCFSEGKERDDFASDVFLNILPRITKWKISDCPFRSRVIHLIQCAIYDEIQVSKRNARIKTMPFNEDYLAEFPDVPSVDPREQIFARIALDEITRTMFRSAQEKLILELYFKEALSAVEVAERLGTTEAALNSKIQRLRNRARKHIPQKG